MAMEYLPYRFVKFGLVGGLATLAHYSVMFTGLMFWEAAVVWSFCGALVGALTGYVLNYTYTFQSTLPHSQTTMRYGVITVLSILLNTGVFYVFFSVFSIRLLPAQICSTLIVFLCNYLAHKYITFEDKDIRPS